MWKKGVSLRRTHSFGQRPTLSAEQRGLLCENDQLCRLCWGFWFYLFWWYPKEQTSQVSSGQLIALPHSLISCFAPTASILLLDLSSSAKEPRNRSQTERLCRPVSPPACLRLPPNPLALTLTGQPPALIASAACRHGAACADALACSLTPPLAVNDSWADQHVFASVCCFFHRSLECWAYSWPRWRTWNS